MADRENPQAAGERSRAYLNYPPPGAHPSPGSGPPDGRPPSAPPPPPGRPPTAPPRPAVPPLIRPSEVLPAVLDGILPLLAAMAVAVIALLLVVPVGLSDLHLQNAGPVDYLAASSWLTAASLGTPLGGALTDTVNLGSDNFGGSTFATTVAVSLRLSVLLLTALILLLTFRVARRRERTAASRGLGQLLARAALPAAGTVVALLAAALTTRRAGAFGITTLPGAAQSVAGTHGGTLGIDAPFVFVGPLLLVFAAALCGRMSVRIPAAPAGDPRELRIRTQLALWTPSFRVAWLQLRIIGALAGLGLWIYVIVEAPRDPATDSHPLAYTFAALLAIVNLSVYGLFAGLGVTLSFSVSGGGGGLALGILSGTRPWGLWLLLLAALIGTIAPAVLARGAAGRRFAARSEDYPPSGAWRSAVIGIVVALALGLLGTLELNATTVGEKGSTIFGASERFGPNLLAALVLTAVWCTLAYLALSLSLGPRAQPVERAAAASADPGYHRFQRQFPQAYQQPYPGMGAVSPTSPTIPQSADERTELLEPERTEPLDPGRTEQFEPERTEPLDSERTEVMFLDGDDETEVLGTAQATVALAPPAPVSATLPLSAPGEEPFQPHYARYPQPDYEQQYGSRRRARRLLGIAALVLVVLAGGGLVAYHFLGGSAPSGPQGAVTSYFGDLAAGDAKDAAALAVGPYAGTPVVGPQTVADAANRPSGLTIVASEAMDPSDAQQYRSAGADGRDLTSVAVRYTVHGTVQNDTFVVEQNPKTSVWELIDPYRLLGVSGGWSNTVTVDGVSVAESARSEVFPGGHVVADPSSRDFATESRTAYPVDDATLGQYNYTVFVPVTLPDPTLNSAGQTAAQSAYRAALDACAGQADTGSGDCGIDNVYNGYTCNNVTWTVTKAATVQVDLSEQGADGGFALTASGSTATESGDYSDWIGIDQTFQNEPADLEDSYGSIVFHADGSATVTLSS